MSRHPTAGLLGLAQRAGRLVIGVNGVRAALKRGDLQAVILAGDRSPRTRDKVERLARAREVPVGDGPAAEELGRLFGRGAIQAVGITDQHLARGILDRSSSPAGGHSGN